MLFCRNKKAFLLKSLPTNAGVRHWVSCCTHTAVLGLQGGRGWSAFYRGGAVFVVSQSTLKLRQGLAQAKQEEELVPLGGNPGSACFG